MRDDQVWVVHDSSMLYVGIADLDAVLNDVGEQGTSEDLCRLLFELNEKERFYKRVRFSDIQNRLTPEIKYAIVGQNRGARLMAMTSPIERVQ